MPTSHDVSQANYELVGVMYISDDDDHLPGNSQFILEDLYELSAPYALELDSGAVLHVQGDNQAGLVSGIDSSGAFLEIKA